MLLILFSVISLVNTFWESLSDDDCYQCVRYVEKGANFSSLGVAQSKLIVGARDKIFKLDFVKQREETFPDYESSQYAYENCLNGGRSKLICANYYKVIVPIDSSTVLLCGTSAFNPQCDFRLVSDLSYSKRQDVVSGEGLCPADPKVAVSYTKISPGVGFSGTCREVCNEYAVSRMNLQAGSLVATARTFKTEETLSGADFVYSFNEGDYVYFLFKETALEEEREYVYSRVGRLCKNDVGSSSPFFKDYFKTFLKVRIYCTSNEPGETPFDHNELGGALYKDKVLYTTFSGPRNLYTGSIVCKFTLAQIEDAFHGRYRVHNEYTNKWVPRDNPSPVQCSTHPTVYNASKIVLMYEPISSSQPLYSSSHRLTGLTGRFISDFSTPYFELFSSTPEGDIIRIAYVKDSYKVHDQSFKVADVALKSMILEGDKIYTISDSTVTMVPAAFDCSKPTSCLECISHYYPICGWCYGDGHWSCSESQKCSNSWISPLSRCEDTPQFTIVPKNDTRREGESVILQCETHADQPFYWSRQGSTLPKKSRRMENGYLLIPIVTPEDGGCYQCNMNNTSGAVHAQACISVLVAPTFTPNGKPQDVSIQHGYSNLVLPCSGNGSPLPVAKWERIGSKLPEGSVKLDDGSLKLIRVMTMDAGQYKCTLTNVEGAVGAVITLNVYTPDPMIPNGTEEQLNGNQMIMNKRTIIWLVVCIAVIIVCVVTGFVTYNCRRRLKRRSPAQYIENDNPMAALECPTPLNIPLQSLQNTAWNNIPSDEPTTPLTPIPPGLPTLPEADDEAPPAYTEHPRLNFLPQTSSEYHLLACTRPYPHTQSSPTAYLYQPMNYCNHIPSSSSSPNCQQCSPHFITAIPDDSPNILSTLPVQTVDQQYDTVPHCLTNRPAQCSSSASNNNHDNEPPD